MKAKKAKEKRMMKNMDEGKEKTMMEIVEENHNIEDKQQLATIPTTHNEGETIDVETDGKPAANPDTDSKVHEETAHYLLNFKTELEKASDNQKNQKKTRLEQQRRKTNRCGTKIVMEERKYIYGSYLEITDIPYHVMGNLVLFFKSFDFDKRYEQNFATIDAGNKDTTKLYEKTTYWMFDEKHGKKIHPLNWTTNKVLSEIEKNLMTQMKNLIVEGVNKTLEKNDEYTFYLPGMVRTGQSRHQMLHLDSGDINFEKPYDALIIHIPLEESGQWLRIGKVKTLDGNKSGTLVPEDICLEHKLIHIPFGTGVVLPQNQLHAGHYGEEGDLCFHAIISKRNWESRELMCLGEVVERTCQCSGNSLLDVFEEYASETEVIKETKNAIIGTKNRIGKNYGNMLRKMYDFQIFHTNMIQYKKKYTITKDKKNEYTI